MGGPDSCLGLSQLPVPVCQLRLLQCSGGRGQTQAENSELITGIELYRSARPGQSTRFFCIVLYRFYTAQFSQSPDALYRRFYTTLYKVYTVPLVYGRNVFSVEVEVDVQLELEVDGRNLKLLLLPPSRC